MKLNNARYLQRRIKTGEEKTMGNIRSQRKEILNDVLNEIHGDKSNRPEGVGVTSEEYVESQLMKLWDLL